MSTRKFNCPLFDLLDAGDSITGAAADPANATAINLRLLPPYVGDTVALIADIRAKHTARAGTQGGLGTLTLAQQKLIKAVLSQSSKARETAKRAFMGNPVKLHDEFCVGSTQKSINAIMSNARVIAAALKTTDNAAALATKGWLPGDTLKLDNAITAAAGVKTGQSAPGDELGETAWLVKESNDLYDRLLDIQNVADLEWPVDDPSDVAIRAKFLLGIFPYNSSSPPPPVPPVTTPKA